jgi:calmodulin
MKTSIFRKNRNEKLQELKAAFSLFDIDNDGKISKEELSFIFQNVGLELNNSELTQIINNASFTGEKKDFISFEDFCAVMNTKMSDSDTEQELKEAFKIFDSEGNGYISIEQLKYVLTNISNVLTLDEINELINLIKEDEEGEHIDYNHFINLFFARYDIK